MVAEQRHGNPVHLHQRKAVALLLRGIYAIGRHSCGRYRLLGFNKPGDAAVERAVISQTQGVDARRVKRREHVCGNVGIAQFRAGDHVVFQRGDAQVGRQVARQVAKEDVEAVGIVVRQRFLHIGIDLNAACRAQRKALLRRLGWRCGSGCGGGQLGGRKHGGLWRGTDERHAGCRNLGQGLIDGHRQLSRVGAHIGRTRQPGQQGTKSPEHHDG